MKSAVKEEHIDLYRNINEKAINSVYEEGCTFQEK